MGDLAQMIRVMSCFNAAMPKGVHVLFELDDDDLTVYAVRRDDEEPLTYVTVPAYAMARPLQETIDMLLAQLPRPNISVSPRVLHS